MSEQNPEAWLAAHLAAGRPGETWASVPGWYYEQIGLPVPAVPHQVSDQGKIRNAAGHVLSQRPTGRPRELPPEEQYRRINLCAGGKKVPVLVPHVVLAAHCPEERDGRDTRHLGRGRACRTWNWYPEGIAWGTQSENEMDKTPQARSAAAAKARAAQAAAGTARPPRPTFRCLNWAWCGGMVLNDGSRCGPCVTQVGEAAAVLLSLRMPSQAVGEFFGYTSGDWVHKLAAQYGGYQGSAAEARTQRPALRQRVRLMRVKRRIKRRVTVSSDPGNAMVGTQGPATTCNPQNRTPVTLAPDVTGEAGEAGRWLDAVGGGSPSSSRSVGGHGL